MKTKLIILSLILLALAVVPVWAGHNGSLSLGLGLSMGTGISWSSNNWIYANGFWSPNPVLSPELITNGDFENPTLLTGWGGGGEASTGQVTISASTDVPLGGGTKSLSMVSTAVTADNYIYHGVPYTAGHLYKCSFSQKNISGISPSTGVRFTTAGGFPYQTWPWDNNWTLFSCDVYAVGSFYIYVDITANAIGQQSLYDNISVKEIYRKDLFLSRPCTNQSSSVNITQPLNVHGGAVINLDDPVDPKNYVIGYIDNHDGDGWYYYGRKCVNGTETEVLNATAITYTAATPVKCQRDGNNVNFYYGDTLIGTVAITDASILAGNRCGAMGSDSSVQCSQPLTGWSGGPAGGG